MDNYSIDGELSSIPIISGVLYSEIDTIKSPALSKLDTFIYPDSYVYPDYNFYPINDENLEFEISGLLADYTNKIDGVLSL